MLILMVFIHLRPKPWFSKMLNLTLKYPDIYEENS